MKITERITTIILATVLSVSLLTGFSTEKYSNNVSVKNGISIRQGEASFTEVIRVPVGNDSGQVGYDIDILAFGPQDFLVKDDGSICILDSINEKIVIFDNGEMIGEIDISPMSHYTFAQMFRYYDGRFYVLDLISNTIGIFNDNSMTWLSSVDVIPLPENLLSGEILDFFVDNNGIRLVTADDDYLKHHNNEDFIIQTSTLRSVTSIISNRGLQESDLTVHIGNNNWVIPQGRTEVVGVLSSDNHGNIYVDVHDYVSNVAHYSSERTIRAFDNNGNVLGYARLDYQDWVTYPLKDIKVTSDSRLYIMSCRDSYVIIEEIVLGQQYTSRMDELTLEAIALDSLNVECIVNEQETIGLRNVISLTRNQVNSNANDMVHPQWTVNANNKKVFGNVKLPAYVANAAVDTKVTGVPYCYGGDDNRADFLSNQSSLTAGNIDKSTGGFVKGTTGADCSGFVSRAYGLSTKLNSTGFASFGYLKTSSPNSSSSSGILKLGNMDFIVLSGVHVFLFSSYSTSAGTATVFDAASNATGKVSSRQLGLSNFDGYTGRSPWS